jgi:hypothetical protein
MERRRSHTQLYKNSCDLYVFFQKIQSFDKLIFNTFSPQDDDDEGDQTMKSASSLKKSASADSMGDSDSLPDLDAEPPTIAPEKPSLKEKKSGMNNIVQDVRLKCKFYFDIATVKIFGHFVHT